MTSKIEPSAAAAALKNPSLAARDMFSLSQAISLKRIADEMEKMARPVITEHREDTNTAEQMDSELGHHMHDDVGHRRSIMVHIPGHPDKDVVLRLSEAEELHKSLATLIRMSRGHG